MSGSFPCSVKDFHWLEVSPAWWQIGTRISKDWALLSPGTKLWCVLHAVVFTYLCSYRPPGHQPVITGTPIISLPWVLNDTGRESSLDIWRRRVGWLWTRGAPTQTFPSIPFGGKTIDLGFVVNVPVRPPSPPPLRDFYIYIYIFFSAHRLVVGVSGRITSNT